MTVELNNKTCENDLTIISHQHIRATSYFYTCKDLQRPFLKMINKFLLFRYLQLLILLKQLTEVNIINVDICYYLQTFNRVIN